MSVTFMFFVCVMDGPSSNVRPHPSLTVKMISNYHGVPPIHVSRIPSYLPEYPRVEVDLPLSSSTGSPTRSVPAAKRVETHHIPTPRYPPSEPQRPSPLSQHLPVLLSYTVPGGSHNGSHSLPVGSDRSTPRSRTSLGTSFLLLVHYDQSYRKVYK